MLQKWGNHPFRGKEGNRQTSASLESFGTGLVSGGPFEKKRRGPDRNKYSTVSDRKKNWNRRVGRNKNFAYRERESLSDRRLMAKGDGTEYKKNY